MKRNMTQREFDRTAQDVLRRAIDQRIPYRRRAREVSVRLDGIRVETLAQLADATRLSEQDIIIRALDEYAVKHGLGANVQLASRARTVR